ncbi:MAG: glycosyl hydrolase family 5 [Hyphomicrobium sp.]|uniref:glycosyl hydrolase family 5 n=1 Tax=Hyphomicrobium sp. TaxID=82 RepID=UPI003D0D8709
MRPSTFLAVGALCAIIGFGVPSETQAASVASSGTQTLVTGSAVEQVAYGRYCRRWYRECRARWGFGWRFRRCLVRHGC